MLDVNVYYKLAAWSYLKFHHIYKGEIVESQVFEDLGLLFLQLSQLLLEKSHHKSCQCTLI